MMSRTHLCKVFADILCSVAEIVAEWASIASLTSTLTEELARDVCGIYRESCVSQKNRSRGSCATYSEGFGAHRSGER